MIPRHMLDRLSDINAAIDAWVWGLPLIVLLVGTGLLLTVLTGAAQFRRLGFALREVLGRLADRGRGAGSMTPFEAVATALASTVGVGNIAGVATAISLGGPGALFWLWVSGLLGMCTKYAEIVVAPVPDAALEAHFGQALQPPVHGLVRPQHLGAGRQGEGCRHGSDISTVVRTATLLRRSAPPQRLMWRRLRGRSSVSRLFG